MNDDTFNFFLSPHIDKDYFTSNKPTNFKNFKPQEINLYNNLCISLQSFSLSSSAVEPLFLYPFFFLSAFLTLLTMTIGDEESPEKHSSDR